MAQTASTHSLGGDALPLLILSDGKPGHLNQSVAFAKLLDLPFEIRRVSFCNRFCKAASYLLDGLGLTVASVFRIEGDIPECSVVVSAGSSTYYPNRVLARSQGARSVAIMLPRNYRYAFDLILAQEHDQPPERSNLLSLPVNLSYPEPQGLVSRDGDKPFISFIIGGSSRHFEMEVSHIEKLMKQIFKLFPGAEFLATTSRRTPPEVEALVANGPFRYKVIASRENVNPIADFLAISDYVFVTEDSTSMISEAVSFGKAKIEVLPLVKKARKSKIVRMTEFLTREGYLHVFDGSLGESHRKFDLEAVLRTVWR